MLRVLASILCSIYLRGPVTLMQLLRSMKTIGRYIARIIIYKGWVLTKPTTPPAGCLGGNGKHCPGPRKP